MPRPSLNLLRKDQASFVCKQDSGGLPVSGKSPAKKETTMHKKFILALLLMTAVTFAFGPSEAKAIVSAQISTPNVSVSINGYLPAPPGVFILYDAGRPYYVEREERIYIEERPVKPEKHHHDHGRKHGHH
jgi:hypothetical protein